MVELYIDGYLSIYLAYEVIYSIIWLCISIGMTKVQLFQANHILKCLTCVLWMNIFENILETKVTVTLSVWLNIYSETSILSYVVQ